MESVHPNSVRISSLVIMVIFGVLMIVLPCTLSSFVGSYDRALSFMASCVREELSSRFAHLARKRGPPVSTMARSRRTSEYRLRVTRYRSIPLPLSTAMVVLMGDHFN